MVNLELYEYSGEKNVLNKTLKNPEIMQGLFYNQFDIIQPTITIRCTPENFDFNYCYVRELRKYYFIQKKSVKSQNTLELELYLDVLMTYQHDIFQASATIIERENANKFISNRQNIYDIRPRFEYLNFNLQTPFNDKGQIIMITLKGN